MYPVAAKSLSRSAGGYCYRGLQNLIVPNRRADVGSRNDLTDAVADGRSQLETADSYAHSSENVAHRQVLSQRSTDVWCNGNLLLYADVFQYAAVHDDIKGRTFWRARPRPRCRHPGTARETKRAHRL